MVVRAFLAIESLQNFPQKVDGLNNIITRYIGLSVNCGSVKYTPLSIWKKVLSRMSLSRAARFRRCLSSSFVKRTLVGSQRSKYRKEAT